MTRYDLGNFLIGVAAFPFVWWGMVWMTFVLDFISSALTHQ